MWWSSVTRTSRSTPSGALKPGASWTSPTCFVRKDGEPAPVLALGVTRRFGVNLLAASRNVADRLALSRPLPPEVLSTFRNPSVAPGLPRGTVEIYTCASAGAEAEHIAEMLRSARLRDGLPWTQMAVLVRSGRLTIPTLSRALVCGRGSGRGRG